MGDGTFKVFIHSPGFRAERSDWRKRFDLEDGEGEGMSQDLGRLQNPLPVVSVQVHAAQDVQLGVNPVQPAFDQVWTETQDSLTPKTP